MVSERSRLLSPRTASVYPASWRVNADDLVGAEVGWPRNYQWPVAHAYVEALRYSMSRHIRMVTAPVTQGKGIVAFSFMKPGSPKRTIVIDYADHADQLNDQALKDCACYFKMQFRARGYEDPRIVPGGFVNGSPNVYRLIGRARRRRETRQPTRDVFGRFGLAFQRALRLDAIRRLEQDGRFTYSGGAKLSRYSEFLEECAASRVCIDLPSNSDFCFRLIDYLAVGTAIVAWPHGNLLPIPLVDGTHLRLCKPDLSDLADICAELLGDPEQVSHLAKNAREYFDRYLHSDQLALYYLRIILDLDS